VLLLLAPDGYAGVVFVVVLFVVVVLNRLNRKRHEHGKYHAAIGNARMHVEPFFRPSRQHIIEAREHEEREDDTGADPPDTAERH